MIITNHWSATGPQRLREYHVEIALKDEVTDAQLAPFRQAISANNVDFTSLFALFDVWKNFDLNSPTNYGTWHINHDPTNQSADVEIGALCMGGEKVGLTNWGAYPFTKAHAWMMAAICARICHLKGVDSEASFPADGYGFINGPLYRVSTHGERAFQTPSPAAVRPSWGYFAYSGDPECRWDLSALDASDNVVLSTALGARTSMLNSAKWMRTMTHAILLKGDFSNMLGLDQDPT